MTLCPSLHLNNFILFHAIRFRRDVQSLFNAMHGGKVVISHGLVMGVLSELR